MANQNIGFNPIQCSSSTFSKLNPQEGYLYFVTDTKQIFLGKNGAFIDMCGGINLVYGEKEIEYDNSGLLPDPNVIFYLEDLEKNEAPLVNDLILNKDGCFYRVKSINEDVIETTRLTLQGTGTGGGTGGGGTTGGNYSISLSGGSAKVYSSTADRMDISFTGYYNGTDDNYISYVSFIIKGQENPFYENANAILPFNQLNTIDLIDYISLFNANKTTVTIKVMDKFGAERSTNFTVQIVELSISPSLSNIFSTSSNEYTYSCRLSGATSGVSEKKLVYTFYNENNLNTPVLVTEEKLLVNQEGTVQTKINFGSLSHGVYLLSVMAEAQIVGTTTKIKSNVLTHKAIYFDQSIGNALLAVLVPEKTEQYTNIPIDYMVATAEVNKTYTLSVLIDGKEKTRLNIVSNTFNSYNLYFENTGNYNLTLSVLELGISYSTNISIKDYTGNLPVIDPNNKSLMLYLNPKGQSNDSVDRDSWKEYNEKYVAKISNQHFSGTTGWLTDSSGSAYLKLTSGGKLEIPGFEPFKLDPTQVSNTDSSMGYGMTIELDFEVNGVTDFDEDLIKCISTNQQGAIQVGFAITGNKIKFYNSRLNGGELGALTSLNLVEGKRVRLSFVIEPKSDGRPDPESYFPMCYTYFNGILSNAVIYNKQDSYKQSSDNPATFIVDSTHGQIKIYGIRFYSTALENRVILNNFTASLPTLEERQARYDSNNVYNANNKIDYNLVSAEMYNLQVPYMVITGGYATEAKTDKWKLKSAADVGAAALPTGKKDYRLIDVEVKYPKNEYFKNYEDYSFKCEFANGLSMTENFGNKPSNGGCIMYAQGTSSMEYPVKNLRIRWKNDEDFYRVRPDIEKVEIICMKADYMESSGSHNTGAANLVDALYSGIGLSTPGQKHFSGEDKNTIVTCIKGHPCLIFYSPSGEPGTYEYIGKYNLNLDKATPEPFGFNHDDSNFGYLSAGDKYYEIDYDDEGEYADTFEGEEEKEVVEGEKINSIHCFEFLDNATEVCNFLNKAKAYVEDENGNMVPDPSGGYYTYEETWYNTFKNKDKDDVPGWALGFESRYPEDKIGYHDADALYPLASWINELYTLKQNGEVEKANARFANEYQCYLDKEFLLFYYVFTEALLMADSRVKNMMIATWGKEKRQYKDYDTGETIETNNYIFYPIFYDMDTMLGLDNTGVNRFNYYDEDTDSTIYNGDEVLWNFVRDNLFDDLTKMYNDMESSLLNIDTEEDGTYKGIIPYFNNNQANMANEAFYNGDAVYKYLDPARNGYYDGLNGKDIAPGEAPYLYAAQGDRSIMREYFIINRIKFLRGKYNSAKYRSGDRIDFRWYYPSGNIADEDLQKSIAAVAPTGTFDFTSLQTCYAGVQLGANASDVKSERFNGEETKQIIVPNASSANGTEAYILGVSNLKDLGDLSTKYMQKFVMTSNKLEKLTLGNPHKDYHNPYWNASIEGQSAYIGLSGCTYLQEFNLQNCKSYNNTLDFKNCPVIEKILLTGSSVSGIELPVNGSINELRIPATIKKLSINSHSGLSKNNFSIGGYDYGTGNLIGENGQYINDYSQLTSATIINTPIDTYEMVSNATSLEEYCLQGIDWEINDSNNTPQYCKTLDEAPIEGKTYYAWNIENKQYEPIATDELNSKFTIAKEKVEMVSDGKITQIPILEYLLSKSPVKVDNTQSVEITHAEALSGKIIINVSASVDEYEIYNKYNKYYPNVIIEYGENITDIKEAYRINFYNVDTITEETEPYYSVLTNGEMTLAELTSSTGPAGIELKDPVKMATNTEIFIFDGQWMDQEGKEFYYSRDFSSYTPKENLNLIPVFNISTRWYTVKFIEDGNEIINCNYTYEQVLKDNANAPLYRSKTDDGLDFYQRYAFKGWVLEKELANNPENPVIFDVDNTKIVQDNIILHAYYLIEDVREVPTSLKYFEIKDSIINVNSEYRNQLSGKITLPAVDASGNIIKYIGDFTSCSGITHIFFLSSAKYVGFDNSTSGFSNNWNLVYIELPKTITSIGERAFANDRSLDIPELGDQIIEIGSGAFDGCSNLKWTRLPSNLTIINSRSFFLCSGFDISLLPQNITQIRQGAFKYTSGINIKVFGYTTGSELAAEDNRITRIESDAFQECGKSVNEIWIKNSVVSLIENCFKDYGKSGETLIVHDASGLITPENISLYFGNTNVELHSEV